jgi:hypothetical protein
MKKILIMLLIFLVAILFVACPPNGDSGDAGDGGDGGDAGSGSGILELDTTIDTNLRVANKGIAANSDGSKIYIWSYNEDLLYVWDGSTLTSLPSDIITSSFTDIILDAEGDVYITKGGTGTTGNIVKKWDSEDGSNLWGSGGVTITDGILRGLGKAEIGGTEYIYIADGSGKIHKLAKSDGTVLNTITVLDNPLDVAVDSDENYYVISSTIMLPQAIGDEIILRKYDSSGTQIGSDITLEAGSFYLTLGPDNFLYISSTTFDSSTRKIFTYDTDLNFISETLVPSEYEGYTGGIDTYGSESSKRVIIPAQEVAGSGEVCDVIVFKDTYYTTSQ